MFIIDLRICSLAMDTHWTGYRKTKIWAKKGTGVDLFYKFLASPDALEVIVVSYSLTHLLSER